jgi:SPP1 gp7 family putative phage head morphogenesis protein
MKKRKRDPAEIETERLIEKLEAEIKTEYEQAVREVEDKFNDYMRRFRIKDDIKREAVEKGVLDRKDYIAWRQSQVYAGERWETMLKDLSEDLDNTRKIAISTAKGYMPEAYAINHNYGTYVIESQSQLNTSYTLFDRQTVERLMREKPKLLPDLSPTGKTARKLVQNKALRWDKQKISSAITQGILQGESVPQIAKRLESVADMDHKAAIRNARTMMTGAQNAGRIDASKRAQDMGIETVNVWMATLDMRTRHEHRLLDGQRREIDEPFVVPDSREEIMFPGDPSAAPHLVYNCRCTLVPQVKGFEYDVRSGDRMDFSGIEGMSYEEWKQDRREKPNPITLPEEKAAAIRGSYINEYRQLSLADNRERRKNTR